MCWCRPSGPLWQLCGGAPVRFRLSLPDRYQTHPKGQHHPSGAPLRSQGGQEVLILTALGVNKNRQNNYSKLNLNTSRDGWLLFCGMPRKIIPLSYLLAHSQVGKSTLLLQEAPFSDWRYISMEGTRALLHTFANFRHHSALVGRLCNHLSGARFAATFPDRLPPGVSAAYGRAGIAMRERAQPDRTFS